MSQPKKTQHVLQTIRSDSFNSLMRIMHLCQEHFLLMRRDRSRRDFADRTLADIQHFMVTACLGFKTTDDGEVETAMTPQQLALVARCVGLMEGGALDDVRWMSYLYDYDWFAALDAICMRRDGGRRLANRAARLARERRSRTTILPAYAAHVGERVTKQQMRNETGLAPADFQVPYRQLVDAGLIEMEGRLVVSCKEYDDTLFEQA